MLRVRNSKFRRGKDGDDVRRFVPRKRTRWPGQHVRCGVCGRLYVYGGNGQTDHLMCDGAKQYACWNGITFDGPLAARLLLDAIRAEIETIDGFDESLRSLAMEEAAAAQSGAESEIAESEKSLASIAKKIENLTTAIGEMDGSGALLHSLREAESDQFEHQQRLRQIRQIQAQQKPKLPDNQEWKELAEAASHDIDTAAQPFARLMRELISEIHVHPVRLIDGGSPRLRARLTVNLLRLLPESAPSLSNCRSFERKLLVDLFTKPQREAVRSAVVQAVTAGGKSLKSIAAELGAHEVAVQRAAKLQRLMEVTGVTNPYVPIRMPLENKKYCRHRHSRYQFDPLPGYGKIEVDLSVT